MSQLTEQQAFLAMFFFLETEYRLAPTGEIGGLLGSLSLLPDGSPADPAVKEQWQKAVQAARNGEVNAELVLSK